MPCRCILYVQKIEVVFPSFLLMSHNGRISFCSSMQYTLIEILFWFSNFLIWFSIIEIMSVRFNRCIMRIRRGYVQSVLSLTRYRAATYRVKHTTLSMDRTLTTALFILISRESSMRHPAYNGLYLFTFTGYATASTRYRIPGISPAMSG